MTIESENKRVEMLNLKKTTKKERKINFNKVKHMLTRNKKNKKVIKRYQNNCSYNI